MQPGPFEKWIEKGHQPDANPCGDCARPADERSLVRGGRGYKQGSCVYLAKACWCWRVRVLMEWVEWIWRVALSLAAAEAKPSSAPGTGCL